MVFAFMAVVALIMERMKQVIVVDESLVLPTGKLAAQVAHAAVAAFLEASGTAQKAWLTEGMPKIVVAVRSEAELLSLEEQAQKAGVPAAVIRDAGRTVVAAGTPTCIGLGPATAAEIDKITGALPLL
ncbi:MAG: peptidyl-tRNA hydrolase Pth2 [Acidobacteria bacterium]|nr:peptidyl-tRNA hydrolase Pth2 [Acidobacteriota bacterium]MDA1234735.1 peptidyl-tRNA hydrolase Pth2 [Acidobacteriota bacterium]